jgi:hypothetical protein
MLTYSVDYFTTFVCLNTENLIDDDHAMFSVLASSVVDREFESRSCQTKDYDIDICSLWSKKIMSGSESG